jgi:glycosyltransferase involved in cell wall biosynthesis
MKTYTQKIRYCLQQADAAIAISENTKKEIVAHFNFDPDRIYVTHLASRYHPKYLSEEQVDKIQQSLAYDFSRPYILFVSTIEPRKNIINLVHAFNYLKERYKIPHNLVLIGQKGWNYQDIFGAIASSPWCEQIHHLDYLSDELVALFYSKANAFVYPSYYEGFGLPVLEAMTLGTPVITSNTSSLPEVVGDAAMLVDPDDTIALAEAILKVISDSQLRQELIQKGQQRAKLFSWENTARETLKAYQSLLP